ncbi:hypothetical protein [Collimonas silvisoli]|uniref:hypothetical protein n=1 Tax=Collimonas silvisoli TaxID=2825884 RepID=UPI001B8C8E33|nr:hypothetical protein [Collimonas silvisoli]
MSNEISSDVAQHLNYQTGMFLTSDYMTLEQNYFSNWFWLQNQYLFTPGVLNGMLVTQQDNALSVSQGVAFDAAGNFLILPGGSGNPVTVPAAPTNPFLVYAFYPDTSKATTPVVNAAAQVAAAASVPDNGVVLATVTLDANNVIQKVTDSRVPVTSRLPAVLPPTDTGLQKMHALQGSVSVSTANLQTAGASVSVTVSYLASKEAAFSKTPTVMVSVTGGTPYATAVAAELAQCVITLTSVQTAAPKASTVDLSWIAIEN